MAKDCTYKVLWPRGRRTAPITPFAKRLDTLKGKTICQVWNYDFRGKEIFSFLEEALSALYPGVKFVSWDSYPSDGDHKMPDWDAHPEMLAELGCDAVIVGMGC